MRVDKAIPIHGILLLHLTRWDLEEAHRTSDSLGFLKMLGLYFFASLVIMLLGFAS